MPCIGTWIIVTARKRTMNNKSVNGWIDHFNLFNFIANIF